MTAKQTYKILIAEDELLDLFRQTIIIIGADHYAVFSAETGIEAVEKTKALKPDLVIMDLKLPSLSQRREDIPLLVDHLVAKFNRLQNRDIEGISEEVLAQLMEYEYPGNVRELENIIEQAFVLCRGRLIELHHLPPQYSDIKRQSHDISKVVLFDSAERDVYPVMKEDEPREVKVKWQRVLYTMENKKLSKKNL